MAKVESLGSFIVAEEYCPACAGRVKSLIEKNVTHHTHTFYVWCSCSQGARVWMDDVLGHQFEYAKDIAHSLWKADVSEKMSTVVGGTEPPEVSPDEIWEAVNKAMWEAFKLGHSGPYKTSLVHHSQVQAQLEALLKDELSRKDIPF